MKALRTIAEPVILRALEARTMRCPDLVSQVNRTLESKRSWLRWSTGGLLGKPKQVNNEDVNEVLDALVSEGGIVKDSTIVLDKPDHAEPRRFDVTWYTLAGKESPARPAKPVRSLPVEGLIWHDEE